MKEAVIDAVNTMVQRSGQNFPVKIMNTDHNSVQVLDVEHWPDIFNTLLMHDFPSILISFDTSTTSLSGFTVTLRWRPKHDASLCVGVFIHVLFMSLCLAMLVRVILASLNGVKVEEMQLVYGIYLNATNSAGASTPSLLTQHLRAVMVHSEL